MKKNCYFCKWNTIPPVPIAANPQKQVVADGFLACSLLHLMADSYLTIQSASKGIYRDKGSKFLAFAHPVRTIDEVKELLDKYRKEYYDARHVCYAYMLDPDQTEFRANDDGEPSGTAGRPILGQIRSNNLTCILVVVVRYFGGILLGTSGLIVAYKEATADALHNAEIIEKAVMLPRTLRFPYEKMNEAMRTLKEINAHILSQDWEDGLCVIHCEIEKKYENRI